MDNNEIKFKMTADSSDLEDKLEQSIVDIAEISKDVEKFNKLLNKVNSNQLEGMYEGLAVEYGKLEGNFLRMQKALDSHVPNPQTYLDYKDAISEITPELQRLDTQVNTIFNKIPEVKLNEDFEKALGGATVFESKLGDLKDSTNVLNYSMSEFETLVSTLSKKELKQIGVDLNNEFLETSNLIKHIDKQILGLKASGENKPLLGKLEEESNRLKANLDLIKNKLDQIGNTSAIPKLQNGFSQLNLKASELAERISRIGSRMGKAFLIAGIGTFRKFFSKAIEMSDVASAKFTAITNVIASSLIPIIDSFVRHVQRAFVWIAGFVKALTGIDLIQNAIDRTASSANKLNKATKATKKLGNATKKAGKQAKDAAKDNARLLAGFDEITNIDTEPLEDVAYGNGDIGGINSGIDPIPDVALDNLVDPLDELYDMLTQMNAIDFEWVDRFKEWLPLIASVATAIGTIWAVGKIVDFISKIGEVTGLFNSQLGGGIGMMIGGFALLAGSVWNLVTNWETMDDTQKAVTITLGILGAAFIALGFSIATGISAATLGIGALIALIAGLVVGITAWIVKEAGMNSQLKTTEEATEAYEEALKNLEDAQSANINAIDKHENALKKLEEAEKRTGISGEKLQEQVKKGQLTYKDMTDEQREVYKAYLETEKAERELKETQDALTLATQEAKVAELELQSTLLDSEKSYDDYKDSVVEAFKNGEISAEQARDLMEKAMADMSADAQQTYMNDLPDSIKEGMNPNKYATLGKKFTDWFNETWDKVSKGAVDLWNDITSGFGNLWEDVKRGAISMWDNLVRTLESWGHSIGNIVSGAFNMVIVSIVNWAVGIINRFLNTINGAIGLINKIPGVNIQLIPLLQVSSVPSFAVGTGNVPYDMLAQVHKGEAIIPKRFNEDEFFGEKNDMSETNSLLEELILALRQKEFYISRDEIGKSSVQYIREQNRSRGRNII